MAENKLLFLASSLSYEECPERAFSLILNSLDPSRDASSILTSLRKVQREVNTPLAGVIYNFQAMVREYFECSSTKQTPANLEKKSSLMAERSIKYFVSGKTWRELKKYKRLCFESNKKVELAGAVNFCSNLERKDDYQITSARGISLEVDPVSDCFNLDVRVEDEWQHDYQTEDDILGDGGDSSSGEEEAAEVGDILALTEVKKSKAALMRRVKGVPGQRSDKSKKTGFPSIPLTNSEGRNSRPTARSTTPTSVRNLSTSSAKSDKAGRSDNHASACKRCLGESHRSVQNKFS